MNRIWRYVKQVERDLPSDRRVEIVGELYATLKAQQADLEQRLGRKASDAEIDALLEAQGDPAQVAARHQARPGQGGHDLIERYLAAVGRSLPGDVKAFDVLAELREELNDKVEALETAAGRTATQAEIADILKAMGAPEVVAHGYRSRPALIGPELTPYFWMAQRLTVGLVLALVLVLAVIRGLGTERPVSTVLRAVGSMWEAGVFTFGAVALVFILLDRWSPRWSPARLWDPRHLPQTHIRRPRPRLESLVSLAFDAMFILWWVGLVTFPNVMPGRDDAEVAVSLSAAWGPLHAPILALAVLSAAAHFADVLHPAWSRVRAVVAMAGCAAGVAVVSVLLASGGLVEVTALSGDDAGAAWREDWLDRLLRGGLVIAAVVWAIEAGLDAWRLARSLGGLRTPQAA